MILGGAGDDGLFGGSGDDILYGGNVDPNDRTSLGDDWLIGGAGNDKLYGAGGNDRLLGGAGNDSLEGGEGNDVYVINRAEGFDSILQAGISDGSSSTDLVLFGAGIARDQLWLRQSGNNLLIDVIGEAASQVSLAGWFSDTTNRIDAIRTSDGSQELLASQVQNLVSAMASYSAAVPGGMTLNSTEHAALDGAIAAAWQSYS